MTVDIGKAEFQFVPRSAGYIKTTADGLPGPPVIVYNHRQGMRGPYSKTQLSNQYEQENVNNVMCQPVERG